MDTTYITTMLVVFLVVASLAVSIGYLYVDEEDLRNMAELSALAGTQNIKNRMLAEMQDDSGNRERVAADTVQSAARSAAVDHSFGRHKESALMHALSDNSNRLTTSNDVTVGFWNISTQTYTPDISPVNAMQVRIRRTAESDSFGIGNIGKIMGIISGVQKFNYTPDAVAALSPRATVNFALCTEACESRCSYPDICRIPERKMTGNHGVQERADVGRDRLASSYHMYQLNTAVNLSDVICAGSTSQDICRKQILTAPDPHDSLLRDMESMMYNPNVDASNKEYDKQSGRLLGWWVIAPVTDCSGVSLEGGFERRTVTRYALVRISRICSPGATGCQQNNSAFDAPAETCGSERGLFIDRISCVNCNSKDLLVFPGLQPVLVQ